MKLNDCLSKLAVPVDTLDKIMLILSFVVNYKYYCTYRNNNLKLSISLENNPNGYDVLSLTWQSDVVLEVVFKEYSCISPLSIHTYKRGNWEKLLDTILSSPEFENSFNSRVS